MAKMKYVVPNGENLIVRMPPSMDILGKEGGWVAFDKYWMRRVRCGDVLVFDDKPPIKEKEKNNGMFQETKETKKVKRL